MGLKSYQIFVNDVPVFATVQPVTGARHKGSQTIILSHGLNKIEVSAQNTRGQESLRALMTVHNPSAVRGDLYYLGFGVSDYQHDGGRLCTLAPDNPEVEAAPPFLCDLRFAARDALDLQEHFRAAAAAGFTRAHVKTFIDSQVGDKSLEEARQFLSAATVHDTLVLFIAGHGVRDTTPERNYFYLDHDTRMDDLPGTALPFEQIEALLYESKPRNKLFLVDTCQSGEDLDLRALTKPLRNARGLAARALRGGNWRGFKPLGGITLGAPGQGASDATDVLVQRSLRDRNRFIYRDLTRRSGAIVLASSQGEESSLEHPAWQNGAFTEEILRAMQSKAADKDGNKKVSTDELRDHVTHAVPLLTGERQHPNVERDNIYQKFFLPIVHPPGHQRRK